MADIKRTDAISGDVIHEYDGIEECDNELPNWWLGILYGTMIFAAGYWLAFQQLHVEPTAAEELAAYDAKQRAAQGTVNDEDVLLVAKQPASVVAGKQVFDATCSACHGEKGEGKIGPNLTDSVWLHGGGPVQIFSTIRDGVPAKGMPTWGPVLGAASVKNVAAYVLSIRNTNVPGKAPQGEPWKGL